MVTSRAGCSREGRGIVPRALDTSPDGRGGDGPDRSHPGTGTVPNGLVPRACRLRHGGSPGLLIGQATGPLGVNEWWGLVPHEREVPARGVQVGGAADKESSDPEREGKGLLPPPCLAFSRVLNHPARMKAR